MAESRLRYPETGVNPVNTAQIKSWNGCAQEDTAGYELYLTFSKVRSVNLCINDYNERLYQWDHSNHKISGSAAYEALISLRDLITLNRTPVSDRRHKKPIAPSSGCMPNASAPPSRSFAVMNDH